MLIFGSKFLDVQDRMYSKMFQTVVYSMQEYLITEPLNHSYVWQWSLWLKAWSQIRGDWWIVLPAASCHRKWKWWGASRVFELQSQMRQWPCGDGMLLLPAVAAQISQQCQTMSCCDIQMTWRSPCDIGQFLCLLSVDFEMIWRWSRGDLEIITRIERGWGGDWNMGNITGLQSSDLKIEARCLQWPQCHLKVIAKLHCAIPEKSLTPHWNCWDDCRCLKILQLQQKSCGNSEVTVRFARKPGHTEPTRGLYVICEENKSNYI